MKFKILVAIFAASMFVFGATSIGLGQSKTKKKEKKQDSEKVELKVGDDAPDWELVGSDGKTYKLSNYKGKQSVVVSWYPMALTGG